MNRYFRTLTLFLVPAPDLSLKHPYFHLYEAPSTNSAQRRDTHGWTNSWPLCWRRIYRRGRVNRNSGEQTTDDAVLPAPVFVHHYLGPPAVWAEMPMGE